MTGYTVGIVGAEAAKFTVTGRQRARNVIRMILGGALFGLPVKMGLDECFVSSGHCHLGGVDIWAEEIAKELEMFDPARIFAPKTRNWSDGYRERNLQIAAASDELHVIVVGAFPETFTGKRYPFCYYCHTAEHIKSGGCWTARAFEKMKGRAATWHLIRRPTVTGWRFGLGLATVHFGAAGVALGVVADTAISHSALPFVPLPLAILSGLVLANIVLGDRILKAALTAYRSRA